MSILNYQNPKKEEFLLKKPGLLCEVHQILKKYYLVKEKRFICEYDDLESFNDTIVHINQIIDLNYKKIPFLISQNKCKDLNQRVKELLPAIKEILQHVLNESSDLNNFLVKYKGDLSQRTEINTKIFDREFATQILANIPLDSEGKPDVSKAVHDVESERSLVALAHMLAELDENSNFIPSHEFLTESVTFYIENIQNEAVDLIKCLFDLVDLTYESLMEEVGKCEGKIPDRKFRHFLRSNVITKREHEEIVNLLKKEILQKTSELEKIQVHTIDPLKNEIEKLKSLNQNLQNKISTLEKSYKEKEVIFKRHNKQIEDSLEAEKQRNLKSLSLLENERKHLRKLELENDSCHSKITEMNRQIEIHRNEITLLRESMKEDSASKNSALKNRIIELEKILVEINQENEELKKLLHLPQEIKNSQLNHENQITTITNKHIIEIRKLTSEKDSIIEDLKNKISELNNNNKSMNLLINNSKDSLTKKISDLENDLLISRKENSELKEKLNEYNIMINKHNYQLNSNVDQYSRRIGELELEILSMRSLKDNEIAHLNESNKLLLKKFSQEKQILQEENDNIKKILDTYQNDQSKFTLSAKINELEKENQRLKKDLEAIEIANKTESTHVSRLHSTEITRVNEHYQKIIEDLNDSINKEKATYKRISAERDLTVAKFNDSIIELQKLKDEINFIKNQYETKLNMLNKNINEINFTKDQIFQELKEERDKLEGVNNENIKLRQIKHEADLLILELRERLEFYKVEEEKKNLYLRNEENITSTKRLIYEKKISDLEDQFKENQIKYEKKIKLLDLQISDFSTERADFEKLKISYLDRISELEREIFELRNSLKGREAELELQVSQNDYLKSIITKLKESNYLNFSTLNKDELNLTINNKEEYNLIIRNKEETSLNKDDSEEIKRLKMKIQQLKEELEREIENLRNYTVAYENKLNENSLLITQLEIEKENLTHQIEFIKAEFEKDKNKNLQKINDLNELLKDNSKNRYKFKQEFENEKSKLNLQIISLQQEIKEFKLNVKNSLPNYSADQERVRELEEILLEDRNKIKILEEENFRLKKGLTNEVDDIIKTSEINKRRIFELENALGDERGKTKNHTFELEIVKKQLVEKEQVLETVIEDFKVTKIHSEKMHYELTTENKELKRKVVTYESEYDNSQLLVSAGNPNRNRNNNDQGLEQEKNISELKRQLMQITNQNENLEKENEELLVKEKASEQENIKLKNILNNFKHENEALKVRENELNNYDKFYTNLKAEYEKIKEENEILKNNIRKADEDFKKELTKQGFMNNNSNQKIADLHSQIEYLNNLINKYEVELDTKQSKMTQLEIEIELLKAKLDSQFNEINALKDKQSSSSLNEANNLSKLDEARKYKERIESELNEKKRLLTECQYENDQLKYQNKELKTNIDKLKKKLVMENDANSIDLRDTPQPRKTRTSIMLNPFYEEMKKSPFFNINFDGDREPQLPLPLIINCQNWKTIKPWIAELQGENFNPEIRLNLLYKATRDGFNHKKFKERCRRISPTIVIVHTNFNKIIGGFTTLRWDSPKTEAYEYVYDSYKKTFLFSVTLGKKFKIREEYSKFAICHSALAGPIFGAGSDLEILSDCDKNYNNFSGIGKSFDYNGDPSSFYGGLKYLVKDYEVYEVTFDDKN